MSQPVRKGLSLVEVLAILGVIGILIAMLIPATMRVRYASTRIQCSNNLKQLMLAVQEYESTGRRVEEPPAGLSATPTGQSADPVVKLFPPGCVGPDGPPEERLSWMVALLPYLEQESLARRFDLKMGYAHNLPVARTGIKTFLCPEANQPLTDATTHYVAMAGIGADAASRPAGAVGNGFMGYDRLTSAAAIGDGRSNTIALMETRSDLGPWARGGTATLRGFDPALPCCGDGRPFGGHSGSIAGVAMADGSVRSIHSNTDPKALAAAITIAGGEKAELDSTAVAKLRILTTVLRWLAVVLILRVLAAILSNYPDYFPPNFDATFLLGRQGTFPGLYEVAFDVHLVSSPVVLVVGLILLSETVRRRFRGLHRRLGWVQIVVLLAFVLPSSLVMARRAIGGWPSGLSFVLLTAATAVFAVAGVVQARRKRFDSHRRWMLRTYVLICSAVVLRLISGVVGLFEVPHPEGAYTVSAWASWLVPLAAYELLERVRVSRSTRLYSSSPDGDLGSATPDR